MTWFCKHKEWRCTLKYSSDLSATKRENPPVGTEQLVSAKRYRSSITPKLQLSGELPQTASPLLPALPLTLPSLPPRLLPTSRGFWCFRQGPGSSAANTPETDGSPQPKTSVKTLLVKCKIFRAPLTNVIPERIFLISIMTLPVAKSYFPPSICRRKYLTLVIIY